METIKTLTSAEAAVELHVSEREVRRMAERGQLDRYRQGKKYLYKVKSATADTAVNPIVLRDSLLNVRGQVRELELIVQGQKASRFRWRLVAASAIVSAGIAGGALALMTGMWRGQTSELEQTRQHLAATRETMLERVQAAEARADSAEARARELADQVIEALQAEKTADDSGWL